MAFLDALKDKKSQPVVAVTEQPPRSTEYDHEKGLGSYPSRVGGEKPAESTPTTETGVATIEAVQAVWGNRGRYLIIAG